MRNVAPALRFCLRAAGLAAALGLAGACASEHFAGANGRAPGADDAAVAAPQPTPAPEPTPPASCVAGDKVRLAWSGAAKDCIVDQGATFDFARKECTHLRAASFACDWATVTAQLASRGLVSPAIDAASHADGKLVACGQSTDGRRIVVQWLEAPPAPTSLCAFDPATMHVVTGCYEVLEDGEPVPEPATVEERDRIVYACLDGL
jgi:hypothetical protein